MILTVTGNPTIDRVYYVPAMPENRVIRGTREAPAPSGKGIDVSIALHHLGEPTVAVSVNAGHTGRTLAAMLDAIGVAYDFVEAEGETRTVPVIIDESRDVHYTITAPTLAAGPRHLDAMLERLAAHGDAWGVACAGSLAPGLPDNSYVQIVRWARARGMKTLIDVSGRGLGHSLPARADIVKINQFELGDFEPSFQQAALDIEAGRNIDGALAAMAAGLHARLGNWAAEALVISLGERGALAVTTSGTFHAHGLNVPVVNTNGAGDAMDAGILLGLRRTGDWPTALRHGIAAASAAVQHETTSGLDPALVPELFDHARVEALKTGAS